MFEFQLSLAQFGDCFEFEACDDPQKLPPTRDALLCHCKRFSYVTAIVKNSLQPPMPEIGSDYGRIVDDDGFHVQWIVRNQPQILSCNPFHAAAKNHLAKHVFALVHQTVSNVLRSVSV